MTWTARQHRAEVHVLPDGDCYRHAIDRLCACCPAEDAESENVFVHNAWDKREAFERGVRKPS